MAISVILFSLDSSEDSMGTITGRVILFGTIPTTIPDTTLSVTPPTTHIDTTPILTVSPTIPPSTDYTPASPDYSPVSDLESDPSEDPSSDYIPPLPATLPFLSSTDDSSDSGIPDTPPSPTHGTPFTETTLSTQSSHVASGALRHRVMVLAPRQPIPHGRPYRYHLNGPIHMMTARKRVGPLPTHRLEVRHLVDYSSSDHFSSDDSSRDSSSSSSSETSSDSSEDALLDSASSHSSSDHSVPTLSSGMRPSHHLCSLVPSIHRSSATISKRPSHDSSSVSPSRKRSRSPVASVPLSSPTLRALSYARADLLPSPKRIRSSEKTTDLEGCSEDSFETYVLRETGFGVDFEDESSEPSRSRGTDLEEDVEVVRNRGIDARVVVEDVDREEIETDVRGPVEVRVDRVTHPVVADDIPEPAQEGAAIESVQRDQGHRIVATGQQSVDMLERIRELERDNMRLRDMMDVARQFLTPDLEHQGLGMAKASETDRESQNSNRLVQTGVDRKKEMEEIEMEETEMEEMEMVMGTEEEMAITSEDLCLLERVVGLTHWFEKMETVFYISNSPEKYQLKYATCTLLNSALTWWNSHKRTIGIEAAYAMSWAELMKLITEVYCPRNEVQKLETELWNLVVKGNELTAYTRRFQELVLLCTRMVPNEDDKV
ncbi:reverse transcriptase domain-containing protein [Tanacetum coccineum]|uniref:Reverse transcriptase domain-containing protein n=1 Tax=Tanacetum coccineum TaxID=301880 RepID=A0ABQ5JF86_9ASTR